MVNEFASLEMICNMWMDIVLYNFPGEPTGRWGRPRIHRERIGLESIPLEKQEGSDYYTGYCKVTTNLWKEKYVYAYVTAFDHDNRNSFRLFMNTVFADGICIDFENMLIKIRRYNEGDVSLDFFQSLEY